MNKCNNCGKSWHVYKQCKHPITSFGIINVNDRNQYLMICRKKSLGYVEFIRGKYSLSAPSLLYNLISEMTIQEKQDVVTKSFDELWSDLWKSIPDGSTEEVLSREKFIQLKNGCMIQNEHVTLQSLIDASTTAWESPEWGFPKGRRNNYESDIVCAYREYEEETGYDRQDVDIIKNILPYEEIFTGSNYKSYKHKYFIGRSKNSVQSRPYQDCEVSDLQWLSFDDAMRKIRPYNVERKKVLSMVRDMLNEYTFS